ncbi:MAG: hypothetical protein HF978_11940 [Desulfobacteraceae bacterium]|nr:hypothetical protein [Desulfobacteraceae bacterium]MBC2756248.1 hypothetical protein [Desulfobacteraceae bacterium]
MQKKDKDKIINEVLKLKSGIIREKMDEIFRTQPDNYIAALEEIGFKYYDDDDPEEIEEKNAVAENQDQQDLIDFFEGDQDCSDVILETFFKVKDAKKPNFPLIRKYFKAANQNFKSLILYGLDHYPARIDLLSDLSYFHEFDNILSSLIDYFIRGCKNEMNLETFTDMAREFYFATLPDGYDALYALREIFEPGTDKREIIDHLIQEYEASENQSSPIAF